MITERLTELGYDYTPADFAVEVEMIFSLE